MRRPSDVRPVASRTGELRFPRSCSMLGADLFSQQARIKREELEGKIHDAHMRGELDTVAMYRNQLAKVPLDSEIDFAYTKERPETKLYQRYLERMRDTGQTNLNLDVVDLLAFRWRETQQGGVIRNREDREYAQLYRNFLLYPQELVPILDQQLKDAALEWACAEENLGEGPTRLENEQRAREMHGAVFKVRPYANETRVNMRDLNPQGECGRIRHSKTRDANDKYFSQTSTRSSASRVS